MLWAIVACLAYAIFDEVHQIAIPGRSFEWVDLGTDGAGMALGAIMVGAYWAGRPK
jgi:VanZ family protein